MKSLFDIIINELKWQLQSIEIVSTENEKPKRTVVLIDEEGNISNLIRFHRELCDMCESLNQNFNVPLLMICVSSFTAMLLSAYYAVTEFTTDEYTTTANTDSAITISWIDVGPNVCDFLYNLLSLWFILYSCKVLVDKVKP